jgi:hypothetical protein
MSSATSTDKVRLKPDTAGNSRSARLQADGERAAEPKGDPDAGLQPWQFFVLAALGCATAITFVARGQGPTAIVLLSVLMGTAALIGYATLHTVRPLVTAEEERTVMIGERTRAALEREKLLTLRSIKELEFDRAMGRLSDQDFTEMAGRLRLRAAGLIKQLDSGGGYREQIEKDLAKRLGPDADARLKPSRSEESAPTSPSDGSAKASAERTCASCATSNDDDASFCKRCGQPLNAA